MEKKTEQWFVLRDLKRANAKMPAYIQLQEDGYRVERVFTPMVTREYKRCGRKTTRRVPYLSDLLFVYERREVLDDIVSRIPTLQYRFVKGAGYNVPMVVPEKEMTAFIDLVSSTGNVQYFGAEEVSPALYGKTVRIVGGQFDGREGRLMTARGTRRKRLIIDLHGLICAALEIEDGVIQLIEQQFNDVDTD